MLAVVSVRAGSVLDSKDFLFTKNSLWLRLFHPPSASKGRYWAPNKKGILTMTRTVCPFFNHWTETPLLDRLDCRGSKRLFRRLQDSMPPQVPQPQPVRFDPRGPIS